MLQILLRKQKFIDFFSQPISGKVTPNFTLQTPHSKLQTPHLSKNIALKMQNGNGLIPILMR